MAAFKTYEEIAAWAMGRELVKEIYRLTKGGAFSTFQPFNHSTHIMPKVSFILPAYKRRFLHEAIASILAQTYRDFELNKLICS